MILSLVGLVKLGNFNIGCVNVLLKFHLYNIYVILKHNLIYNNFILQIILFKLFFKNI